MAPAVSKIKEIVANLSAYCVPNAVAVHYKEPHHLVRRLRILHLKGTVQARPCWPHKSPGVRTRRACGRLHAQHTPS